MIPPVLQTERLLLDAVTPADAEAVFELCQDEEVQRWVPVPSPYTRASAEFFTGEYASQGANATEPGTGFTLWAIRDAATARFLGALELSNQPFFSATLGYWLGRPSRGTGIMTEAVETVVEFAFADGGLGLERIQWEALVGNTASALVARKAGFHFEGTLRGNLVHQGRRLDGWHGSLLRTDDREQQDGWPL